MPIVQNAVYCDGKRIEPATLEVTFELVRERHRMGWIGLYRRQNREIERLTVASLRQSEEVKRISSWGAILFAPTLVGTIYGMSFTHMPELSWRLGYPFALLLMVLVGVVLARVFKRVGWL